MDDSLLWLAWLPLVGWFHQAIPRIRGLIAGSSSAQEQLASMLNLTENLDHQGTANIETTLDRNSTINNYVYRIQQHDTGRPGDETMCSPNRKNNRHQKGFALIVGKPGEIPETAEEAGDVHFVGDLQVRRYIMGAARQARATAASVAGDSEEGTLPNVEAIDLEFECDIDGGVDISGVGFDNPGIAEGDIFDYAIRYDGRPVTWGGGGTALPRIGTALETARQVGTTWQTAAAMTLNVTHTQISVQNDISGDTHLVRLLNTPYGQTPNIQTGAKVLYQRAEDGFFYCTSDYTDDPAGTLRARATNTTIWAPQAWQRHNDSIGRVLPHYGADPYEDFLDSGGTIRHKHGAHDLSCLLTSVDVVTSFEADFNTCIVTDCTTQICFLGAAGTPSC